MQKTLNFIIFLLIVIIIGIVIYILYFSEILVDRIILDKDMVTIYIDDKEQITATVLPENAHDKSISWISNNPNVVTVSETGEILALHEGEADIIVSTTDNRVSANTHIKVIIREVEKITLSETNIGLIVGEGKKITATISPENATYPDITYRSSDEKVAIVDTKGNVSAIGNGTADIIVTDVRGKKEARCKVIVAPKEIPVTSITLDHNNARLAIGEGINLKANILPNNASNKKINWVSNNPSIATVDQNGKVTALKNGTVEIKANIGDISASCSVFVKANPIIPPKNSYKYEGLTMKYYVENKNNYYLSYIWMDDPYNQIKKLDSSIANYGKVMSDNELAAAGKNPVRKTLGQMLTGYISNGMIPTSKALIAFNASGFYVKGVWNPPSDYYHNRSNSWFVLTDGKLIRNKDDGTGGQIIGIDSSGNLQIYGNGKDSNERKTLVDKINGDRVKNTWSFRPALIKNGQLVYKEKSSGAHRQGICQIDSNNYVMLTTIHSITIEEEAKVFSNIGCKTAFNLDGGGSTSLFFKKAGSSSVDKVKCSDGSSHTVCRSIVEGIYFIEK